MATYLELNAIANDPASVALKQKIGVAIAIKAQAIAESPSPTQQAKEWARAALAQPQRYETQILNYVLADNSAATVAAIQGASDAAVQTAVNAAVGTLLGVS